MVRCDVVHVLFPLERYEQVIAGDATQCPEVPLPVIYHLVTDVLSRFAAATPAIARRQVVTPRKILERFIKMGYFLIEKQQTFLFLILLTLFYRFSATPDCAQYFYTDNGCDDLICSCVNKRSHTF
jgi:hypothetical protein